MLKFNLHPFLHLRGVDNSRRFLIDLGINHVTAGRLLRGEITSLRLIHIEKICHALHCTPNDLLEWTPDKTLSLDAKHPLHKIARRENLNDLLEKINTMSFDEVEKLLGE